MKASQATARAAPDAAVVLGKALLRAAGLLAVPTATLARIVGTSEATLSRVRSQVKALEPASKEGELALLFLRGFRSLDALFGGDSEQARSWLHAPNVHLSGVPLERMTRVEGLVDVVDYLDAMRGTL